ncbi:MAG: aspartate kinase [Bacteroidales bacterium]
MITISQAIVDIINRKPFITEALNDGIINFSALAQVLKPEVEERLSKQVNPNAIMMSLRRLKTSNDISITKKLEVLIKSLGDIIVRSNLVDYTFRNSETLLKKQQELLQMISGRKDFFYTISQGVYETTFVLSDLLKDELPFIFEGEKLISYRFNLSSITIKLPAENIDQPGLYYFIFRKLAWEGINILEVISTTNEFTILLKDIDIDRAFSAIKRLKTS